MLHKGAVEPKVFVCTGRCHASSMHKHCIATNRPTTATSPHGRLCNCQQSHKLRANIRYRDSLVTLWHLGLGPAQVQKMYSCAVHLADVHIPLRYSFLL